MDEFYDDPPFGNDPAPEGAPRVTFYKRRDLGETLGDTFDLFRQTWREYGWGIIVLVAPLVIFNLVVSIASGAQAQAMEMLEQLPQILSGEGDPEALGAGPSLGLVFVSYLVSLLAFALVQAATLAYLRLYRDGQAGRTGQAGRDGQTGTVTPGVLWEETKPVFMPVLGVLAASVGMLFLLFLFNVVPCLGQIVWLAGMLFLGPLLWMWPVARVFDADGLGAALRQTRARMRGHWGVSLLTLLLVTLVVIVASIALSLPVMGLAFAFGGMFSGAFAVLSTAVGLLFYPLYGLPMIAAALHYFNLAERADGVDLARRVDDLDDLDPPAAPEAW